MTQIRVFPLINDENNIIIVVLSSSVMVTGATHLDQTTQHTQFAWKTTWSGNDKNNAFLVVFRRICVCVCITTAHVAFRFSFPFFSFCAVGRSESYCVDVCEWLGTMPGRYAHAPHNAIKPKRPERAEDSRIWIRMDLELFDSSYTRRIHDSNVYAFIDKNYWLRRFSCVALCKHSNVCARVLSRWWCVLWFEYFPGAPNFSSFFCYLLPINNNSNEILRNVSVLGICE